jgi:hypothetical protein
MAGSRWQVSAGLATAAAVAVAAGMTRLVPDELRPLNFAAVGALSLFAAARLGLLPGMLLSATAMIVSDGLLLIKNEWHTDFLPRPEVYIGMAAYALLGRRFLPNTHFAPTVLGTAAAGSVAFFVITNFASWLYQDQVYGYSFAGLMDCYRAGLPFFRGTLSGDLLFGGTLFALDYALARSTAPKAVAA